MQLTAIPVKILSGQTASGTVDLSARRLVAMQMPAAWTPGTLTFLAKAAVDPTQGTAGQPTAPPSAFTTVVDDSGVAVSLSTVTVDVAESYVAFTAAEREALASVRYVQLKAGAAQAADRTFWLVLEPRP